MSADIHPFPDRFNTAGQRWEPWVAEDALARYFSVSATTIRRWRAEGMPSGLFGRSRRYRLTECERWHAERRAS